MKISHRGGNVIYDPGQYGPGQASLGAVFPVNRNEEQARRSHESCALPRTILFVDDDATILELRRRVFERMGYCVLTASCEAEAMNALSMNAVDGVVLDYQMPGRNGAEIARRIRDVHGDIPIILSSGCLSLPESIFEWVNASVEKGAGPAALIAAIDHTLAAA